MGNLFSISRILKFSTRRETKNRRSLSTKQLVSLHSQYYEKFRMLWFSAEKQPSVFIEFFNSIDPQRTLDKTILTAGIGT